MGVSQQPNGPLGRFPFLQRRARQRSESQAGLCSQHWLCVSPDSRPPASIHSSISTLLTRVARTRAPHTPRVEEQPPGLCLAASSSQTGLQLAGKQLRFASLRRIALMQWLSEHLRKERHSATFLQFIGFIPDGNSTASGLSHNSPTHRGHIRETFLCCPQHSLIAMGYLGPWKNLSSTYKVMVQRLR